jgi:predicted nucleic-acid-binding Zn-ribbon protein
MKTRKQCPKCSSLKVGHFESEMHGGPPFYRPGTGLEVFACAECGYFETYVKDPGSVLEQITGLRWLNAEADRPYR